LRQGCHPLPKSDALEAADFDQLQGEAGAWDELAFESSRRADKEDDMAAPAQFAGDR
jgi:hypothetical protein